jgi:carboxypeptidase family protein/TonB-dependent receptor-like protein
MSDFQGRSVRFGRFCAVLALLLATGISIVHAQGGTGTITGIILDPKGLAVPGAKIDILNMDTGIARPPLSTTDSGIYTAPFLQPGKYQVSIGKEGFQTYVRKDLVLQVGQTLAVDTQLVVGTTVSEITVTGEAPLIEPDRTESSQTVSETQVEGLPLINRRWEDFTLLTPAVTTDGTGGLTSYRGISSLYNGNSVDGANNTQAFFSEARGRAIIVSYVYSPDSIKEFEVSASNYSAEFGQAAGGTVNAVTRSGTNELHGDLFWNLRYPSLNALDPVAASRGITTQTVHQQNQFGGSVGAPILHDKLFFFGTYDGFRKVNPILYTSTQSTATIEGFGCPTAVTVTQCNNAKSFITADLLGAFPRDLKQDVFLGKLDYQLNPANHLSAVFNWQNWEEPFGYNTSPVVNSSGTSTNGATQNGSGGTHERFLIANWNTTLSSNKINDFRFQWGRDFEFDTAYGPGPAVSLLNTVAYGETAALPRPAFPDEHRLQFSDNFSIVKSSHIIKMGVDVNLIHELLINLFQGDGNYGYTSTTATASGMPTCATPANITFCLWLADAVGADLGDGLTGKHWSSFTQVNDPITHVGKDDFYDNDFGAYVEDTWKLRPHLTLNLGLRYDLQHVPAPPQPNTATPLLTLYTSTLNIPQKDFAPRLGLAWQFDSKTVLRAGYGMFYAKTSNSTYYALRVENGVFQQTFSGCTPTTCGPTFPNVFFTPPGLPVAAPFAGALTPQVVLPAGGLPSNSAAAHGMTPDFVSPVAHEVEVAIERQLPWNMSFSATYLLTRSNHLPVSLDSNVAPATQTRSYDVLASSAAGAATVLTTTVPFYTTRIDTTTGAILNQLSVINSMYNGLVLTLHKPMSHDLEVVFNYTYSHALDNGETAGSNGTFFGTDGVLNPYNLAEDYASSDLDQRHRIVTSALWQPSYGKNFKNALVRRLTNGWMASGILTYATGQPYAANIGTSVLGASIAGDGGLTGAEISTFAGPTGGRISWMSRNPYNLPSFTNIDFRAGYSFAIREKYKFDLSADAFNLFNSTIISQVNTTAYTWTALGKGNCVAGHSSGGCLIPSSSYGSPSTTTGSVYGARQLQFNARFEF